MLEDVSLTYCANNGRVPMKCLATLFVAAFICLSSAASAATLGDAFELTESIKVATDQRCPESKSGDMASMIPALKCRGIDMQVAGFGVKLAQLGIRLMEECIA